MPANQARYVGPESSAVDEAVDDGARGADKLVDELCEVTLADLIEDVLNSRPDRPGAADQRPGKP